MQLFSNLLSEKFDNVTPSVFTTVTSSISAYFLTDEQKKDPAYMLSQFTTWEFLKLADNSLLEDNTYRYKCFYVTDEESSLPENHTGFTKEETVKMVLKHLLNEDPKFLLDCIKNGKNKHFCYVNLPEKELQIACLNNNELFELVPLNLCLYDKKQPSWKHRNVKTHMSEEFWIPLAKVNNKAIDYWVKESHQVGETPDGRYYAILQTGNPHFFNTAPEELEKKGSLKIEQRGNFINLKNEITLLQNFYHDKSFIKIAIESKLALNSIRLNSIHQLPAELTNRIAFTIFDLFIKDFFEGLYKINEIYLKHSQKEEVHNHFGGNYQPIPKVEPEEIIKKFNDSLLPKSADDPLALKSLDDLIHNIFIAKLKIVRCISELQLKDRLKDKLKEITDGPFKDLGLVQQIYLRDHSCNGSSKLQLQFLGECENDRLIEGS